MSGDWSHTMHRQIYQAYLQGPHALFRLFEDAYGKFALCGAPDPDQQAQTITELSAQIDQLTARCAKLQTEISNLRGQNFRLLRRNAELEHLPVKTSRNSSRPPAADPPWAKRTHSLRQPSARRVGGQPGHRGTTLRLADRPDRIVEHRPATCRHCHAALAAAPVLDRQRQQVWEIVPAKLKVTEHWLARVRCAACGHATRGAFAGAVRSGVQYGAGVQARALYLHHYLLLPYQRTSEALRELFNCPLAPGTVARMVKNCAAGLVATKLQIKRQLRRAPVLHADETGMRIGKRLAYVHVTSTERLTHYAAAARGRQAIDEINILPGYRGTCVHDGWAAYTAYGRCRHALCGAHILRELHYFTEVSAETRAWAAPLKALLLAMQARVASVRATGGQQLGVAEREELEARYAELVAAGLRAPPPAEVPAAVCTQGHNLLRRLAGRQAEVLRFMTDFQVPFDNNQAERDLRMIKLQQKTSGSFRSAAGAGEFCRVRSYVSTVRKQGQGVLAALAAACRGKPLSVGKCKR